MCRNDTLEWLEQDFIKFSVVNLKVGMERWVYCGDVTYCHHEPLGSPSASIQGDEDEWECLPVIDREMLGYFHHLAGDVT